MTSEIGGRWRFAVAGALVLAACAPAATEPSTGPLETATTLPPATAGSVDTSGPGDEARLEDFIPGLPSFAPGDPEAGTTMVRQMLEAEERTRRCMAALGFEYVPYVPPDQTEALLAGADRVEEVGFGIAVDVLATATGKDQAPDLVDDPNVAIMEGLEPTERDAYVLALYGDTADPDAAPGCREQARDEVFSVSVVEALIERVGNPWTEIGDRVRADPRVVELDATWAACMRDRGYVFSDQREIESYVVRRLEEIGVIEDLTVAPDGTVDSYTVVTLETDDPRLAEIQRVVDEEIAMAVAARDCRAGFADVVRDVTAEYEQRFIEEHRAELDAFRQEYGG